MKNKFWSKVAFIPFHECWEWDAGKTARGYGQFWVTGKNQYAHRVSYALTYGPIPRGQVVRHKCDNLSCVRPEHLELGTPADNTRDMVERGRHGNSIKTHCVHGHEFTEENTYYPKNKPGTRDCRTCSRASKRRYIEKQRHGI